MLELMIYRENDVIRQAACRVFVSIVSNNKKIQEFAKKAGAVNLAVQMEREKTIPMRESILGCLSALLKAENFAGKRLYVDGITENGVDGL